MRVRSPEFRDQGSIPIELTCDGKDVSPRLEWDAVPGAKGYALIMEDPDAPNGTFTHWVIYAIHNTFLPKGVPGSDKSEYGFQGINDFGKIGYGGPCPPKPHPAHRYYFYVYAISEDIEFTPKTTAVLLRSKIRGKTIDSGVIMAKYKRI